MKKLVLAIGLVIATSLLGFSQNSDKLINNILSGNFDKVIAETRSTDFKYIVLYGGKQPKIYEKFTPGVFLLDRVIKNECISLNESDLSDEFKKIQNFIGLNSLKDLNKSKSIDTMMWNFNYKDDFKIIKGVDIVDVNSYERHYLFNKTENNKTTSCRINLVYSDNKLTDIQIGFYDYRIYSR